MTVTVNSTFDQFTIGSATFAANDQSQKLKVTLDCGTPYTEYTMTVSASSRVITPANLGLTATTFTAGVYHFLLTITQLNGTVKTEQFCMFVDNNFTCTHTDFLTDTTKMDKFLVLEALKAASGSGCISCDCSAMCSLFNFINTSSDATDCGCYQT